MLVDVLDRSVETVVYNESDRRAFTNYRIKRAEIRKRLINRSRASWVIFKPLMDSQHLDTLLANHPNSRAVWIFRSYGPVARSAVSKWGRGQHSLIRLMATDEAWKSWLVERVPNERMELVRKLYKEDLSWESAAALKWYLRNEIFFDLGLDNVTNRILLVSYEKLVADPEAGMGRIFRFLGLPFEASIANGIAEPSHGSRPLLDLDPAIRSLCEDLEDRLANVLQRQSA